MRWQLARRTIVGVATAGVCVGGGSGAHADSASPTDYLSTIVSVEPATATIEVRMVGGDAFFELVVEPGTTVEVVGYQGEPYLRVLPDGTVEENRSSPTRALNTDRFGTSAPAPAAGASAKATVDWQVVGDGGRYAWHDHRTHWMSTSPPIGARPGDQILEGVVPLVVDGVEVDVTVRSVWQRAPSPAPVWLGFVAGIAGAGVLARRWWRDRRGTPVALAAVGVAFAALVVGVWQYVSMPSETGPRLVWWLLPFVAVLTVGVEWFVGKRDPLMATSMVALIGVLLVVWAWLRRDGLRRAILPTDAPFWLDRLVTATALSSGAIAVAVAVAAMFRPTLRRLPR
jgi:hypothetical protein